jgi:hypothetical protein
LPLFRTSRHSFVGCIDDWGKERIFGSEKKILDVVDAGEGQLKAWALLTMMDDVGERMWGMVVECSRRDILFLILRWYVLFVRLWGLKGLGLRVRSSRYRSEGTSLPSAIGTVTLLYTHMTAVVVKWFHLSTRTNRE